jgi:hypothetical protein
MNKFFTSLILLFVFHFVSQAQIKVSSAAGIFDTLMAGTPIYYQYAWDDPLDEDYPVVLKLPKSVKAFESIWDSMYVSDGSVFLTSTTNRKAFIILDATGWDLIDKGYEDTVNYPNISQITVSPTRNEVEWLNFGFYNELDGLGALPSAVSIKISIDSANKVNFIYGDFSIVRPDLCFEGFGSLRPSITYVDTASGYTTWFIYGDPTAPTIDTLSDTAFANLPAIGQKLTLDFNKTNFIKRIDNLNISVSPNPAVNILNIDIIKDIEGGLFQIFSLDGRILSKGKLANNLINIEQLKSGNYILKVQSNGKIYYSRFIKTDN